jgi:transposase InsO family protein
MPWTETDPMKEKLKFVMEANSGHWTVSELCRAYGVSRKCGHAMLNRYEQHGLEGLKERSRAPKSCPHHTSAEVREAVLSVKSRFRTWGARKILDYLRNVGHEGLPAESTVNALLKREGLVKPKRRRSRSSHPGKPHVSTEEPNDVWTADFKGHFKTKNHIYCYPLTVMDLHTRYLLGCKAMLGTNHGPARAKFEQLFRRHGLPKAILTDNGGPFCSATTVQGLSELSVWWTELGIEVLRTELASPQQNGAHERMHRTLKAESTKPPAKALSGQQRKFDKWRHIYNEVRPHEALGGVPPAQKYTPSLRPYPKTIEGPDYPDHFEKRLVSDAGHFRFKTGTYFVSRVLHGKWVGLEETDVGVWDVYFYGRRLGRLSETEKKRMSRC